MRISGATALCALLLLALSIPVAAQNRDFRAERLVLDDGNSNTIIIRTPAGPITGGTLTIPDPGGAGMFLISNPSGGSQSVSGDILPGVDDTYDLGSGASRWQDIFASGNVSIGGQTRYVETGGGTDYVGFQAPAAVTANQIWTLPAADGTNGQVLTTNGSGILSWGAAGGGGTVSSNATLIGDGSGGSPLGINLAQGNTWTGLQQFNASFTILGNGRLALTNNDNNARDIRWQEPSGTGSQYVGLRAPTVARNSNYVFPAAIGTAGQVLALQTVNGFGDSATLTWVNNAATAPLSLSNNSGTTPTVTLDNSNGTGVALELTDGRLIVSSSTTNQAGVTIPDDVVMARVGDDGAGTQPNVTLPASPSDGQVLYLVVEDADGVNITNGLTAGVDPTADGLFILVYLNGGWSLSN